MGNASSSHIQRQESVVRDKLKNDKRTTYLKQQGCTEAQILCKYRQEYNHTNNGKNRDDFISGSKMVAAENYAKTHQPKKS